MAAITSIALGIGALASGAQAISGASQAKKARRSINSYQRQEIVNPYGGLQVSTLGAELQQESIDRRGATAIKALQGMGGRGIFGGLASLEAQQQEGERKIRADLDEQAQRVAQIRAQGGEKAQDLMEQREREDLQGLGAQLSAGQQSMWGGLSGLASIGASAAMGLKGGKAGASGAKDIGVTLGKKPKLG